MPTMRVMLALGVLALGGCVGVAEPLPVGQVVNSNRCYAGFYQCALSATAQVGTPCACPGIGAPSFGVIR